MTEKQEIWRARVTDWRASGKTAVEFSARHGFPVSSLRSWSSRLRREATAVVPVAGAPRVRLAKVVRSTEPAALAPTQRGAVIIELRDAGVRVLVEAGVDRGTLATVLDLVGKGGTR